VTEPSIEPYGDPTTRPFWEGAELHELRIQHCTHCGHYQFYPRPLCLNCFRREPEWVAAKGTGVVYSRTTVYVEVVADLPPPYTVAIVELDEGPRMTSHLVEDGCGIGERVKVAWKLRRGLPPLPVFEAAD
jgi:uncharacterized OB-fold protein